MFVIVAITGRRVIATYGTVDGEPFADESDANAHAARLRQRVAGINPDVITIEHVVCPIAPPPIP